ncbi:hypothetical protein LTR05_005792 [Lithohypha guttulata]|uniref:Rab-GAP TBC domain-containing protein n=1 Tax=Lithohypha guttulata TaxID=1690604 RepID=A0AAN7Y689_9EURO|nr:hypothetical protein LTR05_005792 [Lithohypha guttulata]
MAGASEAHPDVADGLITGNTSRQPIHFSYNPSHNLVFAPQTHLDSGSDVDSDPLHANLPLPATPLPSDTAGLPSPVPGPSTYMGYDHAANIAQRRGGEGADADMGDAGTNLTAHHASTVPQIELATPSTAGPISNAATQKWLPPLNHTSPTFATFQGLSLDFPSSGLSEEIGTNNLKFSARGSMLIDGKKANGARAGTHVVSARTMPILKESSAQEDELSTTRKRAVTTISERPQTRSMSSDEEALAEKVRAFYVLGTDTVPDQDNNSVTAKRTNLRWQDAIPENRDSLLSGTSPATSTTDVSRMPPSPTFLREDNELAGGLEDWQDVDNSEVDRYGFIVPKTPPVNAADASRINGVKRTPTGSGPGLQRVSTSLQLAAETPRRKHTIRRAPSNARSTKSDHQPQRSPSQHSLRSTKSVNLHRPQSASRNLANRFPHNKDRRILDEAGDMLTLPRSSTASTLTRTLTDEGTTTTAGTYAPLSTPQARRKEVERQEKWRKMAHEVPAKPGIVGGGMTFSFDTASPKLIEQTGYVQGMAALAATFLAYYEEEKAFIMLVRLWELRGLEKLYKYGFGGLMEALDDFEKLWLGEGELKKKLDDLMIGPTAYGTRWYLTLFNYSIPFPSQLRVWDVFILLGDDLNDEQTPTAVHRDDTGMTNGNAKLNGGNEKEDEKANFGTTLDVLHATSAALIDGMRGILLDSDFENAMKVLTSWVPIRDEDLFMRVARAEWKLHEQRRLGKKKS